MHAIIADDEKELRTYLKTLLARVWPELEICGEAGNGEEALRLVQELSPDIAFLDIRMPGIDGLAVAERIADECHVVFTTAYDEYALEAFEKKAVDYLLKPVDEQRLASTAGRLRSQLRKGTDRGKPLSHDLREVLAALRPAEAKGLQWIRARQGSEIALIPVAEVICFRSGDKYTAVVTKTTEFLIRKPVRELEQELDPKQFWRIHRSTIVNVARIDRVSRSLTGRYVVRMEGLAELLMVSRTYAHRFRQM